jgi:hypothetical protein
MAASKKTASLGSVMEDKAKNDADRFPTLAAERDRK